MKIPGNGRYGHGEATSEHRLRASGTASALGVARLSPAPSMPPSTETPLRAPEGAYRFRCSTEVETVSGAGNDAARVLPGLPPGKGPVLPCHRSRPDGGHER